MITVHAMKIAVEVIEELKGRSGIGNAFDEVDDETMEEIVNTVAGIIQEHIREAK